MNSKKYKVVSRGLAQGRNPEEVKNNLSAMFKSKPERISGLLKGTPTVVRSGLDQQTALKYKKGLEKAGLVCQVSALAPAKTASKPDVPKKTATRPEKTMICPKCGFEQEEHHSCVQCGIAVEKFLKRQQEEHTAAPPGSGAVPAALAAENRGPDPETASNIGLTGIHMVEEKAVVEPVNFSQELPTVFYYPFKGNGVFILAGGVVVFSVIQLLSFLAFSGVLALLTAGYIAAYMIKTIVSTSEGEEEPPPWPEFSDFSTSILWPLFKTIWVGLFCYGPSFIFLFYMIFYGTFGGMSLIVLLLLLLLGSLYYPIGLMAVSIRDNLGSISPTMVFPALAVMKTDYLICLGFYLLLIILNFFAEQYMVLPLPIVSTIIQVALSIYFMMVVARMLGLLYRAHGDELDWDIF